MNLAALIRGEFASQSACQPVGSAESAGSVAKVAVVAVADSQEGTAAENIREREISIQKNSARDSLQLSATATFATPATDEPEDESGTEWRRLRVLAMLADPGTRLAVVVDDPDSDPVRVMVGVRHIATAELEIPLAYYNLAALMELLDRHATEAMP